MKRFFTLLLSLTVVFALLVGFGQASGSDLENDTSFPSKDALVWEPEITFSTVDSSGEEWTDLCFQDAELTMLNLWAYWCPPCVAELPDLQKLSEDYAEQGFQIFGVSREEYEKDNIETMEKLGVSYPCLRITESLEEPLRTGYIPTTIFVNREGQIVSEQYVGGRSYESWAEIIEGFLEEN